MSYIKKTYFLGAIFFIVMIALIITAFAFSSRTIEEKQTEFMHLQRDNTANEIEYYFSQIENTILNLEDYILEDMHTDPELLSYLQAISDDNDLFYSIYFVRSSDGSMINSSGFVPDPDFDATTRPWYRQATQSEGIIYTGAYLNATQDRLIINVAKAIYMNNQLYGVLSTDIDISDVTNIVNNADIGDEGYVFIIDSQEHLIAKPGLVINQLSIESTDIVNLSDFENKSSGLEKFYQVDGESGALAYRSIANDQYMLFVFLPMNEFLSPVVFIRDIFYIVASIFIVTTLLLLIIYNKNINQPYQNLINAILDINIDVDPSYRIDSKKNKDHTKVIQAINQVLDASQFYLVENQQHQHELTLENQRVKLLMNSAADIIFELDKDARYTSIYGKGLKKIQLKASDFIGRTVTDIYGIDDSDREIIFKKALSGENIIYDWVFVIEGRTIYFESSVSPVYDENNEIIGAVGITRDVTEPVERKKQIEHISTHDFLTDLYNRRYFVDTYMDMQANKHYPIGILMMDLNGLKIFNDAYGHDIGDQALIETAKVLEMLVPENGIVARIGGDEFAILTDHVIESDLIRLKEDIQQHLSSVKVKDLSISIAIGIHLIESQVPIEKILKLAEDKMYRNKITEGKSSRNNAIQNILERLLNTYEEERVHATKVSRYSKLIGQALGLKADDVKELELAGLYHDIGKITIPESILYKASKLSEQEYEVIKKHTENGYNILRAADEYSHLANYALYHHERFDGTGYPQGLSGKEIPYFSRIICVADAFESMTNYRSYKEKKTFEEATQELKDFAGKQFDPDIVKVFVESVIDKITE